VEYGEKIGVEYGENSPSNERHEASCSREFLPNDGFGRFLTLYCGWNTEKEVGQRRSSPGVECGETPLFRKVECGENFACKDGSYEIVRFLGIPLLF
jgi:hypothetical protein